MIDWEKTRLKFGYGEGDLPRTSNFKVICRCDNPDCQAPHDVRESTHMLMCIKEQ